MSARRPESFESRGRRTLDGPGAVAPSSESPAGSRIHSTITVRRASLMQEPVLVLNATYEPINVTAVRRAIGLLLKRVAPAEETPTSQAQSAADSPRLASVVQFPAYRTNPQPLRALFQQ